MKKTSLTLKISLLVSAQAFAMLIMAALFISSFNTVLTNSATDARLRDVMSSMVSTWEALNAKYGEATELGPKFFAGGLSQPDFEAVLGEATALKSDLEQTLQQLDSSLIASWNEIMVPEVGESLNAQIEQMATQMQALEAAFSAASAGWISKVTWMERKAVETALQEAVTPLNATIKKLDTQYSTLVNLRSKNLVATQESMVRNLAIGLIILLALSAITAVWVLGNLKRGLKEIVRITQQLVSGDLTANIRARENGDEVDEVKLAISRMNAKLSGIVGTAVRLSGQLRASTADIMNDTEARFRDAEAQQQKMKQLASAIQELQSASQQVSEAAVQSLTVSEQANEAASHGNATIKHTVSAIETLASEIEASVSVIEKLDGQAENITTIISSIQAIAEQTNLLALNAAIEAARAGDQGRGFAVVADEVRKLAHRTQQSTEEIQQTLEDLRKGTRGAVDVIGHSHSKSIGTVDTVSEAGTAIERFVVAVEQIKDWTMQTSAAAEQQNATLSDITATVNDVNTITEENTQRTQASVGSTESLSKLSQELLDSVSFFKVK